MESSQTGHTGILLAVAGAPEGQCSSGKAYYTYLFAIGPKYNDTVVREEYRTFLKDQYDVPIVSGYQCSTERSDLKISREAYMKITAKTYKIVELEFRPSKAASGVE